MGSRAWERFFRAEAGRYLEYVFTKNTETEADFILRELGVSPGDRILDVGCGTGRHALQLTRRGCRVTGIDQSPEMLAVGRAAAAAEGLAVEFVQGDASEFRADGSFDHAISVCEGAFSLLEAGAASLPYHTGILANVHAALRPGGAFLLTALNGLRLVREHSDADVAAGHFEPSSISHVEEFTLPDGENIRVREKGFLPAELESLLTAAGFRVRGIWGGTAGAWNKLPPSLDEIELMAIADRLP